MHLLMEYLAGPQPMHHAPTLQMVGGLLGHLRIARALCTLDQWVRTLHRSALLLRHYPPNGVTTNDVMAIYCKLLRVTHTPSFSKVHSLLLPTIDIVLLPACMDLGPVLFGAQLPTQLPTWVQLGFVIRQIVNQLREMMQVHERQVSRQATGQYGMPLALERVLASLLVLIQSAFLHNRLKMHDLMDNPYLESCRLRLSGLAKMATLSATSFLTSVDWKPYARHRLLEVLALLRFLSAWPRLGAVLVTGTTRVSRTGGGVALPHQAIILADNLQWHPFVCPTGLFLMDALDCMLATVWVDKVTLFHCANWHDPTIP